MLFFRDFAGPSLGGFLYQEVGFEWMATYTAGLCLFTVSLAQYCPVDSFIRANWINQFEPSHEIMVLFVLRKLILQIRMRSYPMGARCLIFGRTLRLLPYFMCANSEDSGETAQMRRLA